MFVLLILPKEALQFLKGQVLFVKGVRVELFTNLWMSVVVRGGGERGWGIRNSKALYHAGLKLMVMK